MVEIYFQCQSDNGTLLESMMSHEDLQCNFAHWYIDHALRQWSTRYFDSLADIKDLRIPLRLLNVMREAGFVDVEQTMLPLPTCAWSNRESSRILFSMPKDIVSANGESQ